MNRESRIDHFNKVLSEYSNNIFICKKDIRKALNLTQIQVDEITLNLDFMGTRTHLYLKTEVAESIVDYMTMNTRQYNQKRNCNYRKSNVVSIQNNYKNNQQNNNDDYWKVA